MKKKIISLIGILTLIFTFGLSNVYALDDWNFEFRSSNGTASDTVWDLYFNSVLESVDVDGGAISAWSTSRLIDSDNTNPMDGEVIDWTGGWHGASNANGPGGYAQNPGGVTDWGVDPPAGEALVPGYLTNMSGDQGPHGLTWAAGMSAHIATYTFEEATTLVFADMYNDTFMAFGINNYFWSEEKIDTGNRMTSPGVLWNANGSTAWGMTSVPVPAAVWLLGSAMLGILGFNRKSNKN